MTNIDLRSPHGGSRAKLLCVAAALLGAMVVTMLPLRAEALSCRWPKQFYFLDCEGGKCLPLFRTDFAPSHGWGDRVVLHSIEPWEVDSLSAEIDRRDLVPDGVIEVWVGPRLFAPQFEIEHSSQLESATIKPRAESAKAIRREWKRRAREQLWAVVILRLPVWAALCLEDLDWRRGRSAGTRSDMQLAERGRSLQRSVSR